LVGSRGDTVIIAKLKTLQGVFFNI